MICPKCNSDVGEERICPDCGEDLNANQEKAETVVSVPEQVETVEENNEEQITESNLYDVSSPEPKKKSKKVKAFVFSIIAVVLLLAISAFIFFLSKKGDDKFVERTLYVKDNSLYYLESKNNTPVLLTDSFLKDEDASATDLMIMNAVEFSKNGNKVFFAKKIDIETDSFSLYYLLLNKPESEPVKIAEDVVYYFVDDTGDNVIYMDIYDNLYSHNMVERKKIISEVEELYVAKDCSGILYLIEDGGLYFQAIGGEKVKIDSDVTSVYKTGDNLEYIYYYKNSELYLKKTDSEKIKIDSDILDIVLVCDNGGVYYTKENKVKGTGTLMDYIIDPEGQAEKDEKLIDDYYYSDYKARNEALYRAWTREVLEETEIDTVDSLYFFDGEKSDLVNASFVEIRALSSESNALIFKSFDNVNINKVKIGDFINELDKKEKFRANVEKGISTYKTDFQKYDYFNEFSKMILGAMTSDSTTYIVKDGTQIKIATDSVCNNFVIADTSDTVYYIDKYDEEKKTGELRIVKIADGAVVSNELYDSDVSEAQLVHGKDIIYLKDAKDDGDLYYNKQLIEYDVNRYYVPEDGNCIFYYTEYDKESYTGTLNIYSDGEKKKIAENASDAHFLENGNVLYFQDYSQNSFKGDLYIYTDSGETKIDYDVQDIYLTTDEYSSNFVVSYDSYDSHPFSLLSLFGIY
ncbi:MAG: hypothetical protein ACI4I3_05370 [Acutalibacteraceae bacterium]